MRGRLEENARRLRGILERLRRFDLRPRFAADRRRLEAARAAATQTIRLRLARRRASLEQLDAKLSQLSPLRILDRGYAIVTTPAGQIVKEAAAAPPGSEILVRLARGRLEAQVTRSR